MSVVVAIEPPLPMRLLQQRHALVLLHLQQQPPHDPAQVLRDIDVQPPALLAPQQLVRRLEQRSHRRLQLLALAALADVVLEPAQERLQPLWRVRAGVAGQLDQRGRELVGVAEVLQLRGQVGVRDAAARDRQLEVDRERLLAGHQQQRPPRVLRHRRQHPRAEDVAQPREQPQQQVRGARPVRLRQLLAPGLVVALGLAQRPVLVAPRADRQQERRRPPPHRVVGDGAEQPQRLERREVDRVDLAPDRRVRGRGRVYQADNVARGAQERIDRVRADVDPVVRMHQPALAGLGQHRLHPVDEHLLQQAHGRPAAGRSRAAASCRSPRR